LKLHLERGDFGCEGGTILKVWREGRERYFTKRRKSFSI
jgi:hypothetical protein